MKNEIERNGRTKQAYKNASIFKTIGYSKRGFMRWNYILATNENVIGHRSNPSIICNLCGQILKQRIKGHIALHVPDSLPILPN